MIKWKKKKAILARFDIVPEYSFVLGTPAPTKAEVMRQIERDILFIKDVKEINPDTEVVIYVYKMNCFIY